MAKISSSEKQETDQGKLIRSALGMASGTMMSRILGLVRDLLFLALFSRTVTDAWTAAFRLPNLFRRLLGEGSLSVSFIPVFVETRHLDSTGERSRQLVNCFYSVLLVILGVITALGIIFPEFFLNLLLDQAYSQIPGKWELTVRYTQIMFSFIFLMSTYAFFMGILNALGIFALPAFAPTLWNVAMIVSTLLPPSWFSVEGEALAWGVIWGGLLQVGILIPILIKKAYWPRWSFHWRNADNWRVWRNMIPGMLGMGLSHITTVVNMRFASSLGEGPISYIYAADRLLELPLSLIAVSLGTAILPAMAGHWVQGRKELLAQDSLSYFRINFFAALPCAIGLFFLADLIVSFLFQRGKFTASDAAATASVVQIYALTLIVVSSVRVTVPAYYAAKNTWWPATVSGLCLGVHLLVAPYFISRWGLPGLVSSTLLSSLLNLLFLLVSYRFLLAPLPWRSALVPLGKMVLAGAGMAVTLLGLTQYFSGAHSWWAKAFLILGGGGLSVGIYFFISGALRLPEQQKVASTLRRRLKRS